MADNIKKLLNREVLVEFIDGGGMQGYCESYISAEDNYPDPESVLIRCRKVLHEIAVEEIKRIQIIV